MTDGKNSTEAKGESCIELGIYPKILIMHRAIAFFFSVFLLFTALAETTHTHAQTCDVPCPTVCLGTPCGSCSDNSGSKSSFDPVDMVKTVAISFIPVFVHRLSDDEIFHPPAA
ncbi:MAG: hypothetical protein A3I76_03045 [Elusimicrobia bacterium RIFCSPLOWO2_02_FULL_61_11]|nr:MAG: hypothetical protein A3I76_03045 [Elusimicrobia bacterium RIFCSPLOWO2_02_FULL_61_11]